MNNDSGSQIGRTLADLFYPLFSLKGLITIIAIVVVLLMTGWVVTHVCAKPGTVVKYINVIEYTKKEKNESHKKIENENKKTKNLSNDKGVPVNNLPKDLVNRVNTLSEEDLKKYLGQLFMLGFVGKGNEIGNDDIAKKLINEFGIGGLLFYERNFLDKKVEQSSRIRTDYLIGFLKKIQTLGKEKNNLPLFLATDFEGGNVAPLVKSEIMTPIPSPMALGAIRNANAVKASASIIGREMNSLGFNMNLAPVIDVTTSETNNVIQERSFGEDPNMVIKLSEEFMNGLHENNIISVIKHFPGHGTTEAGFETPGLPICKQTFSTFKSSLKPFRHLTKLKYPTALMTSHLDMSIIDKNDRLDSKNISFNKKITTDLLQTTKNVCFGNERIKGIGFNGIVIADNLLAPCLNPKQGYCDKNFKKYLKNVNESVLKAFDAGHSLLMLSHVYPTVKIQDTVRKISQDKYYRWGITVDEFQGVYKYLENEIFNAQDPEQKACRIKKLRMALKKIFLLKMDLVERSFVSSQQEDFFNIKENYSHKEYSDKLFLKSFTILKSIDGYSSLSNVNNQNTLVVFMPSRFHSYKGIESLKKQSNYSRRLNENVMDFDFTRSIYKYFNDKTNLIFELEKKSPQKEEFSGRAKKVISLLDEHDAFMAIFLINKRSRWYLLHEIIEKMNRDRSYPLNKVVAIVTNDSTLLRSSIKQKREIGRLLSKINIVVAYSGYGYRAELLARSLCTDEISQNDSTLPMKIDEISPMPDYSVSDSKFFCE